MKNVLLLGTGKSANVLIDFLLRTAREESWKVTLADIDLDLARKKSEAYPEAKAVKFDINDENGRHELIRESDLVISMLPAVFHPLVARDCIQFHKHLITPSYISSEMRLLDSLAKEAGVLILNEIGLDPGIDHMSAMKVIEEIKAKGHRVLAFESFTGGLVAPESDNNPWHYKFTWNPRNVVLAGQGPGGVKFIHNGKYKYIPYHRLFERTEIVQIPGHGDFEGYANRDSLKYRDIYGLEDVRTMYRGTFRKPGFCKAWNILVQIGMTDDSYKMEDTETMTYREFTNTFLKYRLHDSVELKLAYYVGVDVDSEEMAMLDWLGLFSDEVLGLNEVSPAQVLQHILERKWTMEPEDKDMIVMWHLFNYHDGQEEKEITSSMVVLGENQHDTAMAKTVGLPIGIAAKLILNGTIDITGVHLPTLKEIYNPILKELSKNGIVFEEREQSAKEAD